MKKLTIFRGLILLLFTAFISVNLWGQTPEPKDKIDLSTCTVTVNGGSPYGYTGKDILVDDAQVVVKTNTDEVPYEDYEISWPATIKEKGRYTLTVTAKEGSENYTGSNDRNFYVLAKSGDNYTISDLADWDWFAKCVLDGYSFAGLTVKLIEDVGTIDEPVNAMVGGQVGSDFRYFSGTFDGKYNNINHTLNFYRNSEDYGYAPFKNTFGATIKNLNVTGSVLSTYGYAAGLIAFNEGETNVQYVTVSMNIDDGGGWYCGGFVAESHGNSSIIHFSNCVYNGKITAAGGSAGFVSPYDDDGTSTFDNCIFNPTTDSEIVGNNNFGIGTVNNATCYYTMQVGESEQGTRLYKNYSDAHGDIIVGPWEILGENVYGPVTVTTTAEETYLYDGTTNYYDNIIGCTVHFDDYQATPDDCVVSITDENGASVNEQVINTGEYKLIITTKDKVERVYYGSETKTFYVVSELTGEGTSENPFKIRSSADWLVFANHVNNGHTYTDAAKTEHPYSEAYYKLTNDIIVSTMVGTQEHPFSGNFNGRIGDTYGAYTLTFNYGTAEEPTKDVIVAPFRYTNGATIQSLILHGAIHTNAGKEAGLIGVNTSTNSNYTTVSYVINYMDFYCYEDLWDAQGGGYAYDGSDVRFSYSSYEGLISASNYHGGFCGKANGGTKFERCLFDPESGGIYWAENFVYEHPTPDLNYATCYYTIGNNQEESTQGNMVYVNVVPEGNIGHKITTFHEKKIYEPVTVVIGGVNDTYIYTGNDITITPTVTFNGGTTNNAITNHYCTAVISPSTVHDVGTYTLTVTAPYPEEDHDYLGTINQLFYVVSGTSGRWTALQARLNNPAKDTIQITSNITAGAADVALSIPAPRTVTIYLNGHTIDRGKSGDNATPVTNGQVLRIAAGATVIIEGGDGGTIKGGYNIAANNNENANNDGGGISNLGNLTLNNVIVRDNRCKKTGENTSRTARGGGIYSGKNSNLIINGGEITNNKAEGGGGGIFVYQAGTFTMNKYNSNVQPNVHSNTSKDKGGGIRVDATNSTTATINDGLIKSNTVEYLSTMSVSNGGGLHLDAGNLTLENCVIDGNRASKFGGGIYIMGGQLYANNCSINNNMSYDATSRFNGCGGGICLLGGKCYLNGGTISGNSSSVLDGGGIYVNSGTLLSIQGTVNITGNWKFISNTGGSMQTTNVYLVKADGKITIAGNITGTTIGVSKKGDTGVFTSELNGNGTIANFSSDNSVYSIVPYDNEAKLAEITPVTPPSSGTWNINEPMILNTAVSSDVTSIVIGANGCLYVNTGGYINGVNIDNTTAHAENKLIINGGQVIPSNSGVMATVKKDISYALPLSQGNWYLLSSPLVTPTGENPVVYNPINILNNTNLIVKNANNYPEYDLYRFNEAVDLQWENYRAHSTGEGANFTTLEKGRGYLYRNYNDYTITMTGAINVESPINYALSYNEKINDQDNILVGFNIIGNPYTHNISKGVEGSAIPNTYLEAKYYVLNETDGSWDLTNDGTAIPPVTGILVQATEANTLTITNSTTVGGSKDVANNNIWFAVANDKFEDKACVEFRKGHGLNKITHLNEEAPMLYVHHGDEDFASVDIDPETKAFDLNFEAKTMGRYTLSVKPQGEFGYLHLIDKVEGSDIDLLAEGEYSFIGSPSDSKDRFVVRLSASGSDDDNQSFAYQSGDDIVVSGEGELRVFDMMGRLVMTQHIDGVEMIRKPSQTGVYIFRLNEVSQKIVVK